MKKYLPTMLLVSLSSSPLLAGEVGTVIEFTPNTTISAEEMNANFAALIEAINDNNARNNTNAAGIAANTTSVSTNADSIQSNTVLGASNLQRINDSSTSITSNSASIAANSESITDNAAGIASNVANVAGNASTIADNTTGIASNSSSIAANSSSITSNISATEANSASITTNSESVASNSARITALQQAAEAEAMLNIAVAGRSYNFVSLNSVIEVVNNEESANISTGGERRAVITFDEDANTGTFESFGRTEYEVSIMTPSEGQAGVQLSNFSDGVQSASFTYSQSGNMVTTNFGDIAPIFVVSADGSILINHDSDIGTSFPGGEQAGRVEVSIGIAVEIK